ncbi:MAG: phosphoglucosamine mutase [Bacteroidales bacterium]|nr:phosphoglucosamine mutase [Bacteroidales bacterium]
MTLIKSISGIRGTIGGTENDNLTPPDIVKFTAAYAQWLIERNRNIKCAVVLGRDARVSGDMVRNLVAGTLQGMGVDVTDIGLATTPTVEIAVAELSANGGIILTASHNPAQWNALKLLNEKGEFISADDGSRLLEIIQSGSISFADFNKLGKLTTDSTMADKHIQAVLDLPYTDTSAIRQAGFKVAIDCVNSVGGLVVPELLKKLGVEEVIELYCEPNGLFQHNPEPLPENLTEISGVIKRKGADLGFVVDPDVDRLAVINEDGSMFGEEYTLVAVADYVLGVKGGGNTVSNLSSTQALKDITTQKGGKYDASAVGEVNVVEKMKEINAVIGGEGNGGIILPDLHYGRDALVGIALFLTHLAKSKMKCSELRAKYPAYVISKNKIELSPSTNVDLILKKLKEKFSSQNIIDIDGVKIHFEGEWVHLRKSNTEPIIRIYAESKNKAGADKLAAAIISEIESLR